MATPATRKVTHIVFENLISCCRELTREDWLNAVYKNGDCKERRQVSDGSGDEQTVREDVGDLTAEKEESQEK